MLFKMSNIGSHTFRNATNGSVIHVDVGLHEDIDYDFFDSGDNPSFAFKTNNNKNCTINNDEEKEAKDKNSTLKLTPCGDGVDSAGAKVIKLKAPNFKEAEAISQEELAIPLKPVKLSTDSAKEVNEINLKKEILSSKEDKHINLRDLMNCIAYGENKEKNEVQYVDEDDDDDDDHVVSKLHSLSPDFLSLSTDTTSEITDVTTRPSSSGCSSMSKQETGEYLSNGNIDKPLKNSLEKQQNYDKCEDETNGSSMKLLLDALDSFDRHERKSVTSSVLSTVRRNNLRRKNMSFNNEQCRRIERENEILLKKLENLRKPRPKQSSPTASQPRLSSSAINRRKQQAKIDHDNMILLKKIEQVKPTTRITMNNLRR